MGASVNGKPLVSKTRTGGSTPPAPESAPMQAKMPSPIRVEVREAVAVVASAMTVSEDGSAESQSKAEAPRSALTVEQVLARANEKEKTTSAREMPQTVGTIGSEAAGPEDPQDQFICDSCQ